MKTTTTATWTLAMAAAILGLSSSIQAASFELVASTSGNWNSRGVRTGSLYQIGHSTELPNEQAAYFEFDLTPVKGKTVTSASTVIPGSTDYNITSIWNGHAGTNFKVGIAPQGPNTVAQITTTTNNSTLYINAADANRNQDLGYGWVHDGVHKGFAFDTFHYNNVRLQNAVNAGGPYILWACDRDDNHASSENYIWGSTSYNTGIILTIVTR